MNKKNSWQQTKKSFFLSLKLDRESGRQSTRMLMGGGIGGLSAIMVTLYMGLEITAALEIFFLVFGLLSIASMTLAEIWLWRKADDYTLSADRRALRVASSAALAILIGCNLVGSVLGFEPRYFIGCTLVTLWVWGVIRVVIPMSDINRDVEEIVAQQDGSEDLSTKEHRS